MSDIKERILESAAKCFMRYGYSKTTLDDIGKNVGLKKNSLYHYFKNKEEIFLIVLQSELSKITLSYRKLISDDWDIKKQITTYFELKLNHCGDISFLTTVLSEIWSPNHPLFEKTSSILFGSEISYLEGLLIKANERNEIIDYDFKKFAESLSKVFNLFKQQVVNSSETGSNPNSVKDQDIVFVIDTMLKAVEKK